VNIISCPTCGRCRIDLRKLVRSVENKTRNLNAHLTIAVMGCVVNGPGEAREADIGIAGSRGRGILFKKGKIIKRLPEDQLLDALFDELGSVLA
jgi:(E)-4-hydroxy-3-methylbut-2-enyl-diphosphate synthase